MATTTVGTEFAVMYVVGTMAVPATSVDGLHLVQRYSVAVVASDIDVSAIKWELRLCIVIEGPNVPGYRVVAGTAAIQEIAVMWVIITMARSAPTLFTGECLRCMTTVAFLFFVHTVQRESAQVVIKKRRVLPVHFSVATLTLGAQRSLMRIVI